MAYRMPPPVKIPINTDANVISGMNAAEDAKITMPGREMISGMIWWSKSIKEMTISTQTKLNQKNRGRVRPNFKKEKQGKYPSISPQAGT